MSVKDTVQVNQSPTSSAFRVTPQQATARQLHPTILDGLPTSQSLINRDEFVIFILIHIKW